MHWLLRAFAVGALAGVAGAVLAVIPTLVNLRAGLGVATKPVLGRTVVFGLSGLVLGFAGSCFLHS